MTRIAWIAATLIVVSALPAGAQRPSVLVSASAQIVTGDEIRLGGQHRFEPDLTVQLVDSGFRFGNLYADLTVTRRNDHAVIGRGMLRLDGVRIGGLTWSIDGGDTRDAPAVQDFGFPNLFAPQVTFRGVSVRGFSSKTSLVLTAGGVTAQRNIFGTDTLAVGQHLFQASFAHRINPRVDVQAHAVYVHSGQMNLYTALTDRSTDVGGGVRYRPSGSVELIATAGATAFRRRGSPTTEYAPTALIGSMWSFKRGWLQANAQQYSIGTFPVANFPYSDRSGVFLSGEIAVSSFARLLGGGEYVRTNITPSASASATIGLPPSVFSRVYGGTSFSLGSRSTFTVRVEGGGRDIKPSKFSAGFESDTGVITTEWHALFKSATVFARYERRSNVDPNDTGSSFTQNDASGQFYLNLRGGRQVFASAYLSSRADRTGGGETLWRIGVGSQLPLGPLYLRAEGTIGRTREWATQTATSRQTLAIGLSGRVADRTYLSIDSFIDHSPVVFGSTASPWMTRSMIRLTHSLPFGAARTAGPAGRPSPGRMSGRVTGVVFADWNGNGVIDAGEQSIGGITVTLAAWGSVVTGGDGRFEFDGVPVGPQTVSLDMASVPADYDAPAGDPPPVTVARNKNSAVALGLLPLGALHGVVYQDVDSDGTLSAADVPVDRAVLVLDDGARTEITRDGRFRFDSVRMGSHTIGLLIGSLPDEAQLVGDAVVKVDLAKDRVPGQLVFLVKMEKRPEVRKVFPPKKKVG